MFAMPGIASASTGTSYEAQLGALNNSGGSGTLMLSLNGSQATITEHVTGLAATFNGEPYPHVQHIHIGAKGECPTMADDTNDDGVISTTEGGPSYGAIGTTLSTSGDTSPAAGTTLTVAPSGASSDYKRTITLDAKTLASLKAGTAVIVVHGLDPATLRGRGAGREERPGPVAAAGRHLAGALRHPDGVADVQHARRLGCHRWRQHRRASRTRACSPVGGALVAAGAAAGAVALRRRSRHVGR